MNKKKMRYSFNVVISAAESLQCKDLHHKKNQYHEHDEKCPAEYELYKHCNELREYMRENLR